MFGEAIIRSVHEWSMAHRTRRQLRALSDAQLNDIGIDRGDIEAVAHGRHPRAAHR